jgi:uncharacterized protein involved in cysteine biosynthesis
MAAGFLKALKQLSDPKLKGVLMAGILGTLGLEIALWVVLWQGVGLLHLFQWEWLDTTLDVGALLVVMVASLWFFPAVATVVVGFFLERVAHAVEEAHYPGLVPPRNVGILESLGTAFRFVLASLGFNLLAIPFYFIPLLNMGVFLLLNGYLLGREYFELVAARRLAPGPMAQMRLAYRGRLLLVGMAGAVLMVIPVVNLAVPVLLTAWMVHVLQSLLGREKPL